MRDMRLSNVLRIALYRHEWGFQLVGGILEESLLPLRLVVDILTEPEAQQAHDGGDCKQHHKEHPVQRHDMRDIRLNTKVIEKIP